MVHIPVSLDDIQESKPVPAGTYDLVITEAVEQNSQAGKPQIRVSIGIEGNTDAPNVSHWISLPAPGDEPGKAKFKLLMLKRFVKMFGIPYSGNELDVTAFAGARAKGELQLSEPDESGNTYNRLFVPRVSDEPPASGAKKPPKR